MYLAMNTRTHSKGMDGTAQSKLGLTMKKDRSTPNQSDKHKAPLLGYNWAGSISLKDTASAPPLT